MKYSQEILNMLGVNFYEEFRLNTDVSYIFYLDENFTLWARSATEETTKPFVSVFNVITILTNPLITLIKEEDFLNIIKKYEEKIKEDDSISFTI